MFFDLYSYQYFLISKPDSGYLKLNNRSLKLYAS